MARYRIVPERSRVEISASSSLHPIHSKMDGLEGWIDLDVEAGGRVNLRVQPGAHLELPVARLKSGNPLEDRELKRRIEARRYPTIQGDLIGMEPRDDEGRYLVRGTVTFKGVTNEHEDEITFVQADAEGIRLEGSHRFDIRDFGMEPPRVLMLKVHPEVDVRIDIVAERED